MQIRIYGQKILNFADDEPVVTFNESRNNPISNLKRDLYFNIPSQFSKPKTTDLTVCQIISSNHNYTLV